ncbi:hypothetical protein J8273_4793 [Carpediemonas membranifera]|uniref:Uncharacterized protein n=1 Tax=Carpediemonas membranifera TaxID=201153 RepID=A0A8J6B5T8_9EUKA|nr:hypothetical protein J8273_4793 [Carpediemonas membranifera]|eukprot:KAG9393674.1 hypothetical protein J8273_4793 [Carpediemonas membranifera]
MTPTVNDTAIRDALVSAFKLSVSTTSSLAGDVPSLLRHAYSRHFKQVMPLIQDHDSSSATVGDVPLESLVSELAEIPPLEPAAQVLLDRARSILTSGPTLSMNIELGESGELPDSIFTLLQGTIFAILVHGGADPDLEDTLVGGVKDAYRQEDKLPWFLCRKFLFTHEVAMREGEAAADFHEQIAHRMYAGRLFELLPKRRVPKYTLVRVPPIAGAFELGTITCVLATTHGVFAVDHSEYRRTQFDENEPGFGTNVPAPGPLRVRFTHCPEIAQYEAGLPVWHKNRLVLDVGFYAGCIILTPVGVAAAGTVCGFCVSPDVPMEATPMFHPVVLPHDFLPDRIMMRAYTAVLSMGDRQMIGGENMFGRLGLGHEDEFTQFHELPFRIDRILVGSDFDLFLSGRQILFAGHYLSIITRLLPPHADDEYCAFSPVPLRFPRHVKGFFGDLTTLIVVYDGDTMCARQTYKGADSINKEITLPFEVTAVATDWNGAVLYVRGPAGWARIDMAATEPVPEPVGAVLPFDVEYTVHDVEEVDVDPVV